MLSRTKLVKMQNECKTNPNLSNPRSALQTVRYNRHLRCQGVPMRPKWLGARRYMKRCEGFCAHQRSTWYKVYAY